MGGVRRLMLSLCELLRNGPTCGIGGTIHTTILTDGLLIDDEMNKLILPIGDPHFRSLREGGCYYVDKTFHIRNLVEGSKYYFLSRPRRFGKTLLVDTMQELFEGSEELFRGLHIHDHWDWSVRHPVVRLSFGGKYSQPVDLENNTNVQLAEIEKDAGIEPSTPTVSAPDRLYQLIRGLHRTSGRQVVVLVDEYDKPILDALENETLVRANRDYLRGLYGVIKDCARYVRFVFVTGISMYSKVSLFSGLNNLYDISLDPEYGTICGYTDADLDAVFAPELPKLDRKAIRKWYNGYSWLGKENVYNPFDVLLLFRKRQFESYWYETGTPSYLHDRLAKGGLNTLGLEDLALYDTELSNFDVESINLNALLFQCGYLTIADRQVRGSRVYYPLKYPNHEVRLSLNEELVRAVTGKLTEASDRGEELIRLLQTNDFDGFAKEMRSFYANVPNEWYASSEVSRYEAFYASLLFACFIANDVEVSAEESSAEGRADLVVHTAGETFVLEFKVAAVAEQVESKVLEALAQMRGKNYALPHQSRGRKVHLLAVVFSRKGRNLAALRVERA